MDLKLNLSKEQQLILLGLILSIIVGLGVAVYKNIFTSPPNEISVAKPHTEQGEIYVEISGAISRGGVYKLKAGDRLLDLIKLAGGAFPLADLSGLNLAEIVKDGEKIIIPSKIPAKAEREEENRASAIININTAGEKELDKLPGVGTSTAKKIIEYRQKNGPFTSPEQILKIPRFGKSRFERMKGQITI